jgi:hypothetical protein
VNTLRVIALLVYTCGAYAYGALVLLWLREWWTDGPVDPPGPTPSRWRELATVGAALQLVSFVWFVVLVVSTLRLLSGAPRVWQIDVLLAWLAFSFPPLIMHISYCEVAAERATAPSTPWRALIWLMYAAMHGTMVWSLLVFADVIRLPHDLAARVLGVGISVGFIFAAVYSIALVGRAPHKKETAREEQSRRWHLALFGLVVVVFGFLVALAFRNEASPSAIAMGVLEISARSLPLPFLFVAAYFEHRFEFFDLFVKGGLSLLLTIAVLTGAFALLLPFFQSVHASPAAPWIYAVILLPVVTALPWLYGRVSATLDRWWLGRRFTTVEAVTHFLAGLRSATSEDQLIERAEQGLSEIFAAEVRVQLSAAHTPPSFVVVQQVDMRPTDPDAGRVLLGARASEAPYFREDVTLLSSLAHVLASIVDNHRLQRQGQEQDQRARELSLHASRSELKALRAQINPHFLFNALNAIAGLIHKDPAVADRTIEQLADVFRYALRGAESEWALLDDELEFVRAYLEVERARFGSRLTIDVRLGDDVRGARVPTMIVQTLVENAVKHGVALVRGPAAVEVSARRDRHHLVVTVADTGPGFDATAEAGGQRSEAGGRNPRRSGTHRESRPKTGGYGLANVRQRLEGYFGEAAALTIERDSDRGRTIVSVSLPLELHAGRPVVSAGAARSKETDA